MSANRGSADHAFLTDTGLVSDAGFVDSLVGAAGVGLVLVGPDSTVQWVNEHAANYFGLDGSGVVGMERSAFLDSHVLSCLRQPEQFPGSDGKRGYDCHVLPDDEREERWLRYDSTPIPDGEFAGGRLEQYVDVTAERTSARFDQFQRIVESTADAVYVVDNDAVVEYANPAAQAQTDRSLSSLTGQSLLSVFDRLVPSGSTTERFERALDTLFDADPDDTTTVEQQLETPAGRRTFSFDCTQTATGAVVTAYDVTDQRQRERRYETLVQNFPNGAVTLVDDELRYQLAGGKLFDDIDETPETVVGSPAGDLSSGDRDVFVESYQAALNGEETTVETSVAGRTLVLRALPVRDDDGVVRTAIGMTQDITERIQREEELRWKSRALDEAPVGVTITDPKQEDNPMLYANRRFCELSGYERDTVLGENCRFLQGPETDPDSVSAVRSAIDSERPISIELLNYQKNGTAFWNQLNIAPIRDDTGSLVNYIGFQRDVTDRKEREQELQELSQRLDIALEETGTGIWVLEQDDDSVTQYGTTAELFGLSAETHDLETYLEAIHSDDRRLVEDALRAARERKERFDVEFRVERAGSERWIHSRGTVFEDSEVHPRMVGVVTDVTDRKHRVHALEKRERVLDELHTATREFYPPGSLSDITAFLAEFTENAFDVEYVSVKQFDEETGSLEPTARVRAQADEDRVLGTVPPGSTPIWESYRTGETHLCPGEEIDGIVDGAETQLLVTPVGDFGVLVAIMSTDTGFDEVDVDLIEVLTANAESAFQRLRSDKVHTAITDELSAQQSRIAELSGIIDSVQAVQRRLAESDSQDALETGVCEELLAIDRFDFVWLGQPTGKDTDLSPAAWAGDADGYLDAVLSERTGLALPAQRAADSHQLYTVDSISNRVFDEPWAKEALSYGFKSALSIPLVYDGVLYGVLTAYSRTEAAFGGIYEDLVTDVASLLLSYSRILEQRQDGTGQLHTELEFDIGDSAYPLQRLAAATDSTLRFDTVTERADDYLRILVTVVDGDRATVLDHAAAMPSIDDAEWFGDDEDSQLSLLVRTPFLESVISRHGGRLLASESTATGTTVRIEIPSTVSHRPILDSLTSRYETIDLVTKRQTHRPSVPDATQLEDILTERQCEILKAAFYGGYYETPRRVKGTDIAESFDISGPAVYNHLQAAHRGLLETVFESTPQTPE